MIIITLIFGCIFWSEWRYLQRNHRRPRTFRIVAATILFLYAAVGALYCFRSQFSLASVIETIFYPLENLIVWRDE